MILHRILLILMIALIIAGQLVARDSGWHLAIGLAAFATYIGLFGAAVRLIEELEIEFTPVPAWMLYILTPLGPFISLWLEGQARAALADSGTHAGFTHLARQ